MNIVVSPHSQLAILTEYFDFNQIPYSTKVLWDDNLDFGRFAIPDCMDDTLLILDSNCLEEVLSWQVSHDQLLRFCQKNNRVWVFGKQDAFLKYVEMQTLLKKFDSVVPAGSLTLFTEVAVSAHYMLSKLSNIVVKTWPFNWHFHLPRIKNSVIEKHNASNDFLLTMVKKRSRPHRQVLWTELESRPGLLDRGHAVFHREKTLTQSWVGDQNTQSTWQSGHPSMDLYLNAWLEVAPETVYKFGYFVTEKTIKPIATKTPFLIVSSMYYLKYLRSLGFQTFNNIINEDYDNQHCIQDRVRLLVDQLEDIIKNGAESFYHASKPVLDHNHQVLSELAGRWEYTMDSFIYQCLSEVDLG